MVWTIGGPEMRRVTSARAPSIFTCVTAFDAEVFVSSDIETSVPRSSSIVVVEMSSWICWPKRFMVIDMSFVVFQSLRPFSSSLSARSVTTWEKPEVSPVMRCHSSRSWQRAADCAAIRTRAESVKGRDMLDPREPRRHAARSVSTLGRRRKADESRLARMREKRTRPWLPGALVVWTSVAAAQTSAPSAAPDPAAPASARPRVALLVGIDRYARDESGRGPPDLSGAAHDVASVRELLLERFGFEAADVAT